MPDQATDETPRRPRRRRWWLWSSAALVLTVGGTAGVVATNYGNQPLGITDVQRATISEEAAAHLEDATTLTIPDLAVPYVATEEVVRDSQQDFVAEETVVEDRLIDRFDLRLDKTVLAGVPVTVVTPPNVRPENANRIAINVHGGGFVLGTSRDRVGLLMAQELGMPVYSVEYTLAPQARYPVAVNEILAVYRALVAGRDPGQVVAFASSAGGNLLLSMLLEAKKQGLPMISGIALFTPCTDLTGVGDSVVANNGRDSLVTNIRVGVPEKFYAPGEDLKAPGLSPVYAEYPADFPATVLTTGTRDFNLSDATRQFWKLDAAGVESRLLVGEGMWHGYHWEPDMPEAVQTRGAVVDFLLAQLDPA
ncbi:alpha/beta hydrolase [Plantactinospora sp. WMMB334]|uniref:alpha/beta hydrolase n=1 Tax=Plantactinospora sp. WMMB334 TaxID=3404119 RepID=UPI003B95D54D